RRVRIPACVRRPAAGRGRLPDTTSCLSRRRWKRQSKREKTLLHKPGGKPRTALPFHALSSSAPALECSQQPTAYYRTTKASADFPRTRLSRLEEVELTLYAKIKRVVEIRNRPDLTAALIDAAVTGDDVELPDAVFRAE